MITQKNDGCCLRFYDWFCCNKKKRLRSYSDSPAVVRTQVIAERTIIPDHTRFISTEMINLRQAVKE